MIPTDSLSYKGEKYRDRKSEERMAEKWIELKDISKSFDGDMVLDRLNLEIHENEFVTLLGPSGCGKTTTLRIMGGFETPDEGQVLLNGTDITHVPANKRPINTVFQRYALFPHLNIFDNIAFGLKNDLRWQMPIVRYKAIPMAFFGKETH